MAFVFLLWGALPGQCVGVCRSVVCYWSAQDWALACQWHTLLSTLMTSLRHKMPPTEGIAYVMMLLVFGVIALAASYGPAQRSCGWTIAAIRHE